MLILLLCRFICQGTEHILTVFRHKVLGLHFYFSSRLSWQCCFFIRLFLIILWTLQVYFCTFLYNRLHFTVKGGEKWKGKSISGSQYVTLIDIINLLTKTGIKYGWDGVNMLTLFIHKYEFSFGRTGVKPHNSPGSSSHEATRELL